MSHTFDVNTTPLTTAQISKQLKTLTTVQMTLQTFTLVAALVAWMCGCYLLAVFGAGVVCGVIQVSYWFKYCPFEDVEESACEDLVESCAATPEGQAYRLAVIEQGRKFVNGERAALFAWAESASARAACKKLYDVPTSTTSGSSQDKQAA